MLRDTIDIEYRNYLNDNQTPPKVIVMSFDDIAMLMEELGLNPLDEFSNYHGMEINVDDVYNIELHSYASFQSR